MPTEEETALRQRRRAWWIASARRADPRKPKLADVAVAVGLKPNSASTISDWENNIGGGPSLAQLERLAAFYGLPLHVFTEPPQTEEEWLDEMRASVAAGEQLTERQRAAVGHVRRIAQAEIARRGQPDPVER